MTWIIRRGHGTTPARVVTTQFGSHSHTITQILEVVLVGLGPPKWLARRLSAQRGDCRIREGVKMTHLSKLHEDCVSKMRAARKRVLSSGLRLSPARTATFSIEKSEAVLYLRPARTLIRRLGRLRGPTLLVMNKTEPAEPDSRLTRVKQQVSHTDKRLARPSRMCTRDTSAKSYRTSSRCRRNTPSLGCARSFLRDACCPIAKLRSIFERTDGLATARWKIDSRDWMPSERGLSGIWKSLELLAWKIACSRALGARSRVYSVLASGCGF